MLAGSGQSFADHRNNHRENSRHEQRDHRPGNKNNHKTKDHKKPQKNNHKPDKHHNNDKYHKNPVGRPGVPGHNNSRPGGGAPAPSPVMRPGQGSGFHAGPAMPPPPPPRLPHMVHYATRGCHDVDVWQVNRDTYLVKYRRGRRWYTQYVYPYAGRYGSPTLISVNWQPQSPWTLIPPIQLNINL